jgi:CRP/FNR family transcriptional regulator, cyclic AMP receptor protein
MRAQLLEKLHRAELFQGLLDEELMQIAEVCQALRVKAGQTIFSEGDEGSELYIIYEGSVRVMINTRRSDGTAAPSTINMLYTGQCFGEMILLNNAMRSATVVAAEPTTLILMRELDFRALCESSPRIGYLVIRNLAQDLIYKLRSSNLLLRGNIRWQHGELGASNNGSAV